MTVAVVERWPLQRSSNKELMYGLSTGTIGHWRMLAVSGGSTVVLINNFSVNAKY